VASEDGTLVLAPVDEREGEDPANERLVGLTEVPVDPAQRVLPEEQAGPVSLATQVGDGVAPPAERGDDRDVGPEDAGPVALLVAPGLVEINRGAVAARRQDPRGYQNRRDGAAPRATNTMWIKADLHIHSSASYDCRTEPWAVVATCLRRGLGAFAIADHNALEGSRAAAELVASYEFADFMERHYPGRPHPRVVVAQEINTRDGEAMGMFISRPLTRGLSMAETIIEIHEQGGLVNIPHPFARIAHRRPRLDFMERFADDIDVVEVFNARNFYIQDDRLAFDFARRHNLGLSAGSDTHFRNEIGRGYVLLEDFDGRDSFLKEVRSPDTQKVAGSSPARPTILLDAHAIVPCSHAR